MTSASRSKGEDVASIAAGLTGAERDALKDELFALRSGVSRVRNRLARKGLVHPGGTANDLGLAVRAHLTDQEGQNR